MGPSTNSGRGKGGSRAKQSQESSPDVLKGGQTKSRMSGPVRAVWSRFFVSEVRPSHRCEQLSVS